MTRGMVRVKRIWILWISVLLVLCGGVVPAEAQQRFAVVIGIGKYQDSRIRALKYTVRDAQAVYQFLTDPAGGGFPRDNVRLLLNEQSTQRAIKNALGQFLPERAVRGDLVFMYYAGHGAPEVDRARREPDGFSKYLVPYDADYADLYSTGINTGEVKDFFDRIESDRVVFVMDACFSGASGGRGFANVPRGRDVRVTGNYLDRLAEGKGRVILTASDANKLSLELDSLRHGLFTYHFLQGLRGKADRQNRGYITLQDVYAYTYDQVARESRRAGGSQSPRLKGDLAGDIILAGRPAPPPPAIVTPRPPQAVTPPVASIPPPASPLTGDLDLTSDPPGATVKLDDREVGKTPLTLERLPVGEHTLELNKDGILGARSQITIAANTLEKLNLKLDRLKGKLTVFSDPRDTTVALDGKEVGTTPLSLEANAGAHTLRLTKDGYKPHEETVTLPPYQETRARIILRSSRGTLEVLSNPPGASVDIGGELPGGAPR